MANNHNSNVGQPLVDWAIQAATEALIGMQNDCNAMMKFTKEETDSILKSVAERMREIRIHSL